VSVRPLTARLCNPLKPTDVLALDADEDAQRRMGVTLVVLDVRRDDGVEGAGLQFVGSPWVRLLIATWREDTPGVRRALAGDNQPGGRVDSTVDAAEPIVGRPPRRRQRMSSTS
jgi:hypothetical protein